MLRELNASPAVNRFHSPTWGDWIINAKDALNNGWASVGNPAADPDAYCTVGAFQATGIGLFFLDTDQSPTEVTIFNFANNPFGSYGVHFIGVKAMSYFDNTIEVASAELEIVPEPSTMLLLGLGMLAVLGMARRGAR